MVDDAASATIISVLSFISKLILWPVTLLLMLDNLDVNLVDQLKGTMEHIGRKIIICAA
jgi:hypothetical protein